MKRRNLLKIGALGALIPFIPNNLIADGCEPTSTDIEGPFYTPNAPVKQVLYPSGAQGSLLFLTGTVYYNDCITPIANATLDAWHTDNAGEYDNIGFNYRGKFNSDENGNYSIETILPGKYLNGASFRPRHIHFKIKFADNKELTTQLYFEGDSDIPADPWASDPNALARIIPLTTDNSDINHGVFNIYLDIEPPATEVVDTNIPNKKGIISIYPNPVVSLSKISVFSNISSKLTLQLFNINGRMIMDLYNNQIDSGHHIFTINNLNLNGLKLNSGVYIVRMSLNNTPIDAKRIVIQ